MNNADQPSPVTESVWLLLGEARDTLYAISGQEYVADLVRRIDELGVTTWNHHLPDLKAAIELAAQPQVTVPQDRIPTPPEHRRQPVRTQIWNNGGGTQSAAIAALIVTGKLPKPDLAAISDTGRERSSTWDYQERHILPALASVGVTMHRVLKEQYATKDLYGGADGETLLIPAFTTQGGDVGKLSAFCSAEWKRDVVRRWATVEHRVTAATNWIGYSTDEMGRAHKAQHSTKAQGKWQVSFPLINLGMDRGACAHLALQVFGALPPRSSCWMCPNMHVGEWREVMDDPRDRPKVIQFDRDMRRRDPHAWLTDQAVPIDQADFDDANEVLFGRDRGACDSGMCFV